MAVVNLKTEIGPLDGTPEKRLFWSIISDYDLKTALTELVDNALDLWLGTKSPKPLSVQVNMDADRQIITLIDNAGGVPQEDLRLLITPGGSNNSPESAIIGIFGVGSKRAVVAVAEHISIKTRHGDGRSFQIDIEKEWLESEGWDLPLYEIAEIESGTTKIELMQLRRKLADTDTEAVLSHFGETYAWFLQQSGCAISVNGASAQPKTFDVWAYPSEHVPQRAEFETWPDGSGCLRVEIVAGLIRDRSPAAENYGVYFYCNNRLIVKDLKARQVGYFVTSEAGVPHPDASLCRAIVQLKGPAKLMPWNSSKNGINFDHPAFGHLRKTLIQLVSHFSSLSRRLKDDWEGQVFPYVTGTVEVIPPETAIRQAKLILPALPKVNKPRSEKLKAKNKKQIEDEPWTLGLVEAMAAVDIITRQKLQTRSRIALILLDSNFEIAMKEFIVHRNDLFPSSIYNDTKIKQLFKNRDDVIQEVNSKLPLDPKLLGRAKHFYALRNKLIHERATLSIPDEDIDNYRSVVQQILNALFHLEF